MVNLRACEELDAKVIKAGLCTLCGACVGNCPYLAAYEGRVLLKDICDLPEGRCQAACPRISLDLDELSEVVFGMPYPEDGLGTARYVAMTRTTDSKIRARAQDAGAVTALMGFAVEEGLIDSAILTSFEDKSWPRGMVASNGEQILKCSGTSYLAAPTIESFNQVVQNPNHRSIGFIGTPCQVMALVKMRTAPAEASQDMSKLKLIVGLFCTWALAYPDFGRFLEKKISDPVVRYEVPPHPANVLSAYTNEERFSFSIDEVLPFVRPACRFCLDLTAEFADLSVGGGRGEVLDWNTVVIRTEKGMKLFDSAVKKGVIETAPIPEGNLSRLKAAAYNKKKRAIENIIRRTGSKDDLLYLKGRPEIVKRLVAECREGSF
jgi:coenzyme F420 hydrogenase subunit beta